MKFAIAMALSCLTLTSIASTIEGRVVCVADGDTITILGETKPQHKIRLNKIDEPEKKQTFGEVSRKCLADMVAGEAVNVELAKQHRKGER